MATLLRPFMCLLIFGLVTGKMFFFKLFSRIKCFNFLEMRMPFCSVGCRVSHLTSIRRARISPELSNEGWHIFALYWKTVWLERDLAFWSGEGGGENIFVTYTLETDAIVCFGKPEKTRKSSCTIFEVLVLHTE